MTATMEDPGVVTESARARVKIAAFMARNGTRAQKRVIASGRAAKHGIGSAGKKIARQITEPYSGLKIAGGAIIMILSAAALWYYSIVVCFLVAFAIGSWFGGIVAAVAFYMLVARLIYMPMALAFGTYCSNAQVYHNRRSAPAQVGRIVGFPTAHV